MAEDESRATQTTFLPQFDAATFWRLGWWGVAACTAVAVAFFVGNSDLGMGRISLAFAHVQGTAPAKPQPRESIEVARLSESVRTLAIDRDRLLARLDALERNFSDLTGSIALSFTPPRPASTPPTQPEPVTAPMSTPLNTTTAPPSHVPTSVTASAPSNMPAASSSTIPQSPPVPSAQEAVLPDTPGTAKPEFGVDLGSAPTVDGLRTLWGFTKNRHATLLEGLRPIIAIRETTRLGGVELRLVVGPIPSAALAARLCVVIAATGAVCQPAVFDGQRLAMR